MRGQAKKRYWDKQRKVNAEKREAYLDAITAKRAPKKSFQPLKPRDSRYVIMPGMDHSVYPSSSFKQSEKKQTVISMDEEEYKIREAAAKLEIERKKKMVAPLYNKGAYQFIGDAPQEIINNLGRKV